MNDSSATAKFGIGIFDSGVGGLSVLREFRRLRPGVPVLYVADQAHVPYGSRPLAEVRDYAGGISRFLMEQGARLIAVACNTASAAALHELRDQFPSFPFVGMEPAVKPAAAGTRNGRIGILATPATFQGMLYHSLVQRYATGITIFQDTCPGLVARIEQGDLTGPATRAILEKALGPMLAAGVDTVVLGCTHYPFVLPLIREICGPDIGLIDPAAAVARRMVHLLAEMTIESSPGVPAVVRYNTTGDPAPFRRLLPVLACESGEVLPLCWHGRLLETD